MSAIGPASVIRAGSGKSHVKSSRPIRPNGAVSRPATNKFFDQPATISPSDVYIRVVSCRRPSTSMIKPKTSITSPQYKLMLILRERS